LPGVGSFIGTAISSTGLFNPAATGLNTTTGTFNTLYTYTTDKGCKDTASGSITVWKVTANAGADLIILEGNSAGLNPVVSGDNLSYAWAPPAYLNSSTIKNPVTTPSNDITYSLTVTGNSGCSATDAVDIKVLKAPVIPNAFSPNNDGINDAWNIRYLNTYVNASIEVYNRYGSLVFRSIGYNKPWDGTFNGTALPVGVYYYIIDPKNGRQKMNGSVTILR
jgi:gliding motility-associated-like protein